MDYSKYTQVLLQYSQYTQVLSDYSQYTQVLLQYSKNTLKFYYTIPKYYTQVSQGLFKPIPQFESGIKVYNRYCCCWAKEYILIRGVRRGGTGGHVPPSKISVPPSRCPPPMCPPHLYIPSPVPPSPVQIDKLPDRAPLSDSTGGGPSTLTRGRLAEHWNIFSQHLNLLEGEI